MKRREELVAWALLQYEECFKSVLAAMTAIAGLLAIALAAALTMGFLLT